VTIPKETPDGPETYLQAAVNVAGTNFTEIKAYVVNQSAWPARALDHASFRYYFTLDGSTTPDQISVVSYYTQCKQPTGPQQVSGRVYAIIVDCTGTHIAPSGQPDYRKEVQFRITSSGSWDPTNDWSYADVAKTPGSTPVTVQHMPLDDNGARLWGTPPS
jgi:hypothetical protein